MEERNGLLCSRDQEQCFMTVGPENLDTLLAGNSLINEVAQK